MITDKTREAMRMKLANAGDDIVTVHLLAGGQSVTGTVTGTPGDIVTITDTEDVVWTVGLELMAAVGVASA